MHFLTMRNIKKYTKLQVFKQIEQQAKIALKVFSMREDIYLYKIFLENIVLDYILLLLITKWST